MNATKFLNAIKLAQKPAAIGFLTIFGLGLSTAFATAISALLTLLIPTLLVATKAAIFGYPLFIAGTIAINIKEQCQKKEAPTIAMLPPGKPRHINQVESIENEVLITPLSDEDLLIQSFYEQPRKETIEQPAREIQEVTEVDKTPIKQDIKTINNQLALFTICWQSIAKTSTLLDKIKASELKAIASELQISKYRSLNKTQLLIEIIAAQEEAPEFSQ